MFLRKSKQMAKITVKLVQVISVGNGRPEHDSQVGSGQLGSGQIKLVQIKLVQIKLVQVKLGQVSLS